MENFQKWKDIQGSIDGIMRANDLEKRIEKLEEGFRKIESKIKGKSQEWEINRGRGKGIIESIWGFELDYKRSHKKVDRL